MAVFVGFYVNFSIPKFRFYYYYFVSIYFALSDMKNIILYLFSSFFFYFNEVDIYLRDARCVYINFYEMCITIYVLCWMLIMFSLEWEKTFVLLAKCCCSNWFNIINLFYFILSGRFCCLFFVLNLLNLKNSVCWLFFSSFLLLTPYSIQNLSVSLSDVW